MDSSLYLSQNPLASNHLPIWTSPSMMGTSQKSPIVVPRAACEPTPYRLMAVAMAMKS